MIDEIKNGNYSVRPGEEGDIKVRIEAIGQLVAELYFLTRSGGRPINSMHIKCNGSQLDFSILHTKMSVEHADGSTLPAEPPTQPMLEP